MSRIMKRVRIGRFGDERGNELMKGKIQVVFVVFLLGFVLMSRPVSAEERNCTFINSNENAQDYEWYHGNCMKSFLVENEDGYFRVDAGTDGDILVEYYDSNFQYRSQRWIPKELPIFGGCFVGADACFLVFGQTNPERSNAKEVVRVVKYDKEWNRLGEGSLYGANTTSPFDAGSLRMAEADGRLYVHTCHHMYNGHQSNMFFVVNEATMDIEKTNSSMSNLSTGYVSHSFNQFIQLDDEYIYRLDHGDAYPRKVVLTKCKINEIDKNRVQSTSVLDIAGETGNNFTGVSVGGLECTSSNCITVGNSIIQGKSQSTDMYIRNVYVTVTQKDKIGTAESKFQWITNYPDTSMVEASAPHLVKINDNFLVAMWNINIVWQDADSEDEPPKQFCYVFLDGEGNTIGNVHTESGMLSDCKPIYSHNRVLWYTTDNKELTFYSLTPEGILTKTNTAFPKTLTVYPKLLQECKVFLNKIGKLTEKNLDTCYCIMDGNKILKEDTDYESKGRGWSKSGGVVTEVRPSARGMAPYYYGQARFECSRISEKPVLRSVRKSRKGVKLSWEKETGALGYKVYRKVGKGKFREVAKIADNGKNSWTDTKRYAKTANLQYGIKAYTIEKSGKEIATKMSNKERMVFFASKMTNISVKSIGHQRTQVYWKKAVGAEGYEVRYSRKKNFSQSTKRYTKKTWHVISKKRDCFVKVRAYTLENGKKKYTKWSKVKKMK